MKKQTRRYVKKEKIPSQKGKSYFQNWLKSSGLGINHLDGIKRDGRDGWYDLAVYILAETVLTAAQRDDPQAAQEAREWLLTAAAVQWFEGCNLDYRSVESWLKRDCPLPDALSLSPFDLTGESENLFCGGVFTGRLEIPGFSGLPSEPIDEVLWKAGWRLDDPF